MNRWFFGLLLILAGALGLLNNFEIIDINFRTLLKDFWPVLLILWGFSILFAAKEWIMGTILVGLGVLFLGRNLDLFMVDFAWLWKVFWPAVIILIGLSLLFPRSKGESKLAVMGSLERKNGPWKLESGSYQAIMGGIELDLRQAEIAQKVTHLDITAIMGGVDITVPADLAVICEGSAFLGGIEMLGKEAGGIIASLKAEQGEPATAEKIVKINCHAILGGIEIKR